MRPRMTPKPRRRAMAISALLSLALIGGLYVAEANSTAGGAGSTAPDFTLPAREGGELALSSLRGQVVMLNFWATWCGPCRQEMPLLEQIHSKYEPLGFTLVGVNVEEDSAAAKAWLQKVPVSFPVLFDTRNAVSGTFGVAAMPSSVLIDRDGKVRYVHHGYKPGDEAKYAEMIRALIKE